MLLTQNKPTEEILESLGEEKNIFLLACNGCAEVCETGGEKALSEMKAELKTEKDARIQAEADKKASDEKLVERITQEVVAMSDSLVKRHELPDEFFKPDQKPVSEDFVRGAFALSEHLSDSDSDDGEQVIIKKGDKRKSGDGKKKPWSFSTVASKFDRKKKMMLDPRGNKWGTEYTD